MILYLIHSLPHSSKLSEGRRNMRTLSVGIMVYIVLHALLFSEQIENNIPYLELLRQYWYTVIIADVLTMMLMYRIQYGKLLELDVGMNSRKNDIENMPPLLLNQPKSNLPKCCGTNNPNLKKEIEIPTYISDQEKQQMQVQQPMSVMAVQQIPSMQVKQPAVFQPVMMQPMPRMPIQQKFKIKKKKSKTIKGKRKNKSEGEMYAQEINEIDNLVKKNMK